MKIEVSIANASKIKAALDQYPNVSVKYFQNAIKSSIFEITARAKELTPVKTGNLRRSFNTIFQPLRGIVQPTASYAYWVEVNDNARHAIGQAHYLETGVEKSKDVIHKQMEAALSATMNEIAGKAK